MSTIDAKNKTTTELAIWLEGLSTGDTVYYTEYPNFDEAAKRLRTQEARIAELEAQTDAEPIYQWKSPFTHGNWVEITKRDYELVSKTDACTGENPITFTRKLYTHPPKQANQWQPIETAPATPAAILLLTTSGKMKIETGHWARNMVAASKVDGDDCFYTHWMPLPEPPIFNGVKP